MRNAISAVLAVIFTVQNAYSDQLAPPSVFQASSPTEDSEEFKGSVLSDIKFLSMAFSIASHFLIDNQKSDTLPRTILDEYRNNKDFLTDTELDKELSGISDPENGIVRIPFSRDGKSYEALVCTRQKFETIDRTGSEWGVSPRFGIRIAEARRTTDKPERDMKGENAEESNPLITRLIKDGNIVEVHFDGEELKAHRVKWIDNYAPGKTPSQIYLGEEININEIFSESEADNLKTWIRQHPVRGSPVKLRIALNNIALGWRDAIENSNIAHAGYRDQCIYIGHLFLRYLMAESDDRALARKEMLEDDEIKHLLDPKSVTEVHEEEAYTKRREKAGNIINLIVNVDRVRKNLARLWDKEFRPLYERAKAMLADMSLVDADSVRRLSDDYAKYLAGDETMATRRARLGLKKNEVIAYYSMEYALSDELPFFAGGLGALAGDHARAASDLLPAGTFICIGAGYKFGYLNQVIDIFNWQQEAYTRVRIEDFGEYIKGRDGKDIVIDLPMPDGKTLYAKAWKIQIGRAAMYLLTTDIEENNDNPHYKGYLNLTYEANEEIRIIQEYILGAGGERLLSRLGLSSRVIHLNEGHVTFAILEKARQLLQKKIEILSKTTGLKFTIDALATMPLERRREYGLTLPQALEAIRHDVGFTSHTPIGAGNQTFQCYIAEKYLDAYLRTFGGFFSDIAFAPIVHDDRFDMTQFAITYCGFFNGVARKHGEVCRGMYKKSNEAVRDRLGRDRPEATNITNAVNRAFYQPEELQELLGQKLEVLKEAGTLGKDVTLDAISWEDSRKIAVAISDDELKEVSLRMRSNGIKELRAIRDRSNVPGSRILPDESDIDPEALIIVFSRRAAEYKRPALVLEPDYMNGDIEVWRAIVREARARGKKAQIIFAGKAHRTDDGGKRLIQRILHIAKYDSELKGTILFVENYDTEVAKALVKIGCFALNNPHPPLEASGTSGMKFLLAAKPNLTVMDGWTLEALRDGALFGVYPFVLQQELKGALIGPWRFRNHAGRVVAGPEAGVKIPSQETERSDGKIVYECLDPNCRHVWSADAGVAAPSTCPKCGRPAIKNNSFDELGLMDIYFNHTHRWCEIMRESLAMGLGYFTSHRMFKEYMDRMYIPTIQKGRAEEEAFLPPELEGQRDPPAIELSAIETAMDEIHKVNLELLPPIETGKTMWHVIPLRLIPQSPDYNQRVKFYEFVKTRLDRLYPNVREKIKIVTDEGDYGRNLVDEVTRLAEDKNNIVDVALDSEEYIDKLPDGVGMLVFKPEGGDLGTFRQLEGILAALRALHIKDYAQRSEKLSALYGLLTGKEPPNGIPQVSDNKEFARRFQFILPPITIKDGKELQRLNENLLRLIESA